ncbi:hypothetical protein BJ546DRAFT_516237 [Cryomyces antarcticus]
MVPVSLELIDSREVSLSEIPVSTLPLLVRGSPKVVESVLRSKFVNLPGHSRVEQMEYVLQDPLTRRDASRANHWSTSFRPGRRILMSIVLEDRSSNVSTMTCPAFQAENQGCTKSVLLCKFAGCNARDFAKSTKAQQTPTCCHAQC